MAGIPDECDSENCGREPQWVVKFKLPPEKLFYCTRHYNQNVNDDKVCWSKGIREYKND